MQNPWVQQCLCRVRFLSETLRYVIGTDWQRSLGKTVGYRCALELIIGWHGGGLEAQPGFAAGIWARNAL